MKVETLLPMGKLDPGLREPDVPLNIRDFADGAALVEELGYDALLVEETKDDPYQLLALGALRTEILGLGTSVAMAFPRSPTITAMAAWSLQKLSSGRFILGLGSQVRGHIRRRYGLEWKAPVPWMRDYIGAVRAVWDCWQNRTKLDYHSDHYDLTLMVPLFDPGPIEHPEIPIYVAAVGPRMCALAGEVADGIRLHPVCTPRYIKEVVKPAVTKGAIRAGRHLREIEFCMKPLVGSAPDEKTLLSVTEIVRSRVAFYLSTPAYRRTFELQGWGDYADMAAAISKAQRWDELTAVVDDELLHTVATLGTYDSIGKKLVERYGEDIDRIEFSIPINSDRDREIAKTLLSELRID